MSAGALELGLTAVDTSGYGAEPLPLDPEMQHPPLDLLIVRNGEQLPSQVHAALSNPYSSRHRWLMGAVIGGQIPHGVLRDPVVEVLVAHTEQSMTHFVATGLHDQAEASVVDYTHRVARIMVGTLFTTTVAGVSANLETGGMHIACACAGALCAGVLGLCAPGYQRRARQRADVAEHGDKYAADTAGAFGVALRQVFGASPNRPV